MSNRRRSILIEACLLILLVSPGPLRAQGLDNEFTGPSLDGTPGLFKTWDAEPIRPGEVFLSGGAVRTHRDPGEMSITTMPGGMAIGLSNRVEIFGTWELQKRIEATGLEFYRVGPGEVPRLTTTATGTQIATSAAPFLDVPVATGRSELYGRVKVNILSERTGSPFALSVVGTGKIPGHKTATGLNRGLSTGDNELGFGALLSKRVEGRAAFHMNTHLVIVAHPTVEGIGVSDLQNRFVLRGGAAFPLGSRIQGIAEFEMLDYFFHQHIEGLNPTVPVDVYLGIRAFAARSVNFSAGYVASLNKVEENPQIGVRPAPTSGFVVQLGLTFRRP